MHTPEEIGIDDFQANRSPDRRYRTTLLSGIFVPDHFVRHAHRADGGRVAVGLTGQALYLLCAAGFRGSGADSGPPPGR
jgi:hypothetical protein